jgi:aminoglycoside 6'-N-acetyltransferase I
VKLVDFPALAPAQLAEAAHILREAFAHFPAFHEPGEAEDEVESFLTDPDRFAVAAVDGDAVAGFIGGIRAYPRGLELHPLAVDPARQGQGIGARLVAELEARAAAEGMLTIFLGTDDEFGGTSLFGADLFPDPLAKLAAIEPQGAGHPFFFYRKLGYAAVGVLPDVNGPGKPDLLMAKRLKG